MVKKSRRGRSRQRGGDNEPGRPMGDSAQEVKPMAGGNGMRSLSPGEYSTNGEPYARSNYYTISGGSRRRSRRRRTAKKNKKGGDGGVLATAALPFGLLALQRYFQGSKSAKKGVSKMGRSFKRTFRRRY